MGVGTDENGVPWEDDETVMLTKGQVAQVAFESAGAGSVPFMEDHPDYVMPSERMTVGIAQVLLDHDIDIARLKGYHSAVEASAQFDDAQQEQPSIVAIPRSVAEDLIHYIDGDEHMVEDIAATYKVIEEALTPR